MTDTVGECVKCGAAVKISRCKWSLSAKFIVEHSGTKRWRMTAFGDQVEAIISGEEGANVEQKILVAPTMKFFVSDTNIVRSVRK